MSARSTPSGYSGTPLPKKLGIGEGTIFATKHPPDGFADVWMYLVIGPEKALLIDTSFGIGDLKSRVPTDLTEDVLRDEILPTGWVDNKVCAIDETWSGLRFTLRRELR